MGISVHDYPVPANETDRLAALRASELIGSAREPDFDAVVSLACEVFDVPIAMVSLIDEDRQWFKASQGCDICSTSREIAFCNYPVASGEIMVIADATKDARFRHNRLVTGGPNFRFYAGAPLSIDSGLNLGALCILDTRPRTFTPEEESKLSRMAAIVSTLMRQQRDSRALTQLARNIEEKGRTIHVQSNALTHYKRIFDRASSLAKIGAWERKVDSMEISWTDGMYDIHELPKGSPVSWEQINRAYSIADRKKLERLRRRASQELRGFTFDAEITTVKGNKRWVRSTVDVECEDGVLVRLFGMKQDITEQKVLAERMRLAAECDLLTGLPNRHVFQARLHGSEDPQSEVDTLGALVLVDLDGFKHVNDTFGHQVGDECLKQVAGRLRRACGKAHLVARLGGDEFAVLFSVRHDRAAIESYARHVLAELSRPIRSSGQSFQLSGSLGIAIVKDSTRPNPSELLTEADLALYAAKGKGKNTFVTFTHALKVAADLRSSTVSNITRALDKNQMELFYQPKMNLIKGKLSGFEALLRWRRPDGCVIAAGAFPAVFEDPKLSDRIGDWVVETALCQASTWRRAGLEFGHVAINLGASQFHQAGFASRFIGQLAEHHLLPGMIEVEVTEGVFLSQETSIVKRTLETLREAGIRIALDDFGTGFASLVHLRTYPVDIIKVDRSFIKNFLHSLKDNAILQSVLFLARRLNVDVVAEGIEEVDQLEFLKALGCRFGQGYLFAKALPASEAEGLCARSASRYSVWVDGRGCTAK